MAPEPYAEFVSTTPPGPRRIVGRAAVPVRAPRLPDGYDPPPVTGPPALVARRRRWPRRLRTLTLTLLLVIGAGVGGWFYLDGLSRNMSRVEAFTPIAGPRPDKPVPATRNLLILGSDSRDPNAAADGGYRADTIILMHLPADRRQGYLISLPRDLWVPIPVAPDGSGGHEAKLNAATAFGGVPLMVRTVEDYTGVRVDHVVLLDFAGFVEVTDAVGGVDMYIEQTIQSIHGDRRTFEQGWQHLSGEEALDYLRQRYQFSDGDFTRMRNQQQFLRSLLDRATSAEVLSDPRRLDAFLRTLTATLTVDEDFSLARVGWAARHLRGDRLTFLTSPHAGAGNVDGQSVVRPDDAAAAELYAAVRQDRVADWVQAHPERLSGG